LSDKNLKRLSKVELIEMLIAQSKRVEELEAMVADLNVRIENRALMVEQAGNLATACIQVNEVLQSAQAAADQYMENIRLLCDKKKAEAEFEAVSILQKAREDVASQRQALRENQGWIENI
jgi:hypothetical protein